MSRDTGRGGPSRPIEKMPLKGLFADAVWQCNCDPRLPAEHFQTKNGGKNHGRWFYTCQKSQPKRCNFFLWDDEAKPREATVVMNNSRSEPHTPKKITRLMGQSNPSSRFTLSKPPSAPQVSTQSTQDEEEYDWPDSDIDEMATLGDRASMPPPDTPQKEIKPPETPRKAVKSDSNTSPGKRRYDDTVLPTPETGNDDVFTTPSTGLRGRDLFSTGGMISPEETPTPKRFKDFPPTNSELATEILDGLRSLHVDLPARAVEALKAICNKHTMKVQGISKGRDISRMAIKTKDVKIAELQSKIAALEAEKESSRAVIRHLRRDAELKAKENSAA